MCQKEVKKKEKHIVGLKLGKSTKNFWSKIGRNENSIMESGYLEQTLYYKKKLFIIKQKLFIL